MWKTDGTGVGTDLVKNIKRRGGSAPWALTDVHGLLFFQANGGSDGRELWKSDGAKEGTVPVKDINPDGNSSPDSLTVVGRKLFFVANDGTHGRELWVARRV
jgi:ELWxxDGT repeat protein